MEKIVIMIRGAEEHREEIERICGDAKTPLILDPEVPEETFREAAADAEAVLGAFPPEWLEGTDVKWVHLPFAGVNRHAGRPGVAGRIMTNSSGAFGATIAEHCLAMLLAFARHLPAYLKQAEQGLWKDCGSEWGLIGRTALVLGTGDLGTQTALRLKAIGLRVLGCRRTPGAAEGPYDEMHTSDEIDALLPAADAVFCCLPSTPATVRMLDARRLGLMRDDAVLINVGRGDLIDTDALVALLEKGKFTGVGLDVTDPEPLPQDHPLWHFANVIITPHVSGIGFGHLGQTQSDVWKIALEDLRRWCAGEPLVNVVDQAQGY